MIIEISGYFLGSKLLFGKKCKKVNLIKIYKDVSNLATTDDELVSRFSSYGFEIIPYDEKIQVDYVVDIDTDRIYSPSY
jgi:hypothetical protein